MQCEGFQDGVIGEISPFFAGTEPFISMRMGLSKFATRELGTTKKKDLRKIINLVVSSLLSSCHVIGQNFMGSMHLSLWEVRATQNPVFLSPSTLSFD